jgi:hypothetical protein
VLHILIAREVYVEDVSMRADEPLGKCEGLSVRKSEKSSGQFFGLIVMSY